MDKANKNIDIVSKLNEYLTSNKKVQIKRKNSVSVFGYLSEVQDDCVLVDVARSKQNTTTFCFGKLSIVDIMDAP
jgi:hypothetical protein